MNKFLKWHDRNQSQILLLATMIFIFAVVGIMDYQDHLSGVL